MEEENKKQQQQKQLNRLTINDFKACKGELSVDIGPGLNILLGKNNSGKSTIMQALLLWEYTKRIGHRKKPDMLHREEKASWQQKKGCRRRCGKYSAEFFNPGASMAQL